MLKKFILFIIFLIPWYLSSLFPVDYNYYETLNLPFFAPGNAFYGIAWTIIYVFTTFSIISILNSYKFKDIPSSYKVTLLINYLFNQSYILVAFGFKNNFLGFISCLGTFLSCLFLVVETKSLKEKSTKLLIPYVLLSLFATILSFTIYVMNI